MAMKIETDGMEELDKILQALGTKAQDVAKRSLYDGAGIMADAFTAAVNSIQTEKFKGKKDSRLPSPEEKQALIGRTGIAKFNATGSEVNTLVGVTEAGGYAIIGGKRKAVRLIARSINSGTSFMKKQPVFRKAKTAAEKTATAAIIRKAEQMYEDIINGSGEISS